MRKKNYIIRIFLFLLAITVLMPASSLWAMTIDADNEYTLYVDEYPGDVTNTVYAKFSSTKKDYEDYALNLVEDDEEIFLNALNKSKISVDESTIVSGFTAVLIYTDPDSGDEKKKTDSVKVLCPLPDDAQEHPDDCIFYQVSSGSAKVVSSQRVKDDDGIIYEKIDLPSYGTYGFVYKDPDSYDEDYENEDEDEDEDYDEDDEDEDEDETYTGTNHDPIEPDDDNNFEYTEDDDLDDDLFEYSDEDFDDDDFTSLYDDEIEEFDSDAYDDDDDDTPYYYEDDVDEYYTDKVQNQNSENSSDNSSSSETQVSDNTGSTDYTYENTSSSDPRILNNTGSTDYDYESSSSSSNNSYSGKVPKTGDDFPLNEIIGLGAISLITLIGTVFLLKRKK